MRFLNRRMNRNIGRLKMLLIIWSCSIPANAITIGGPVTASGVEVTGLVSSSSMTVSTLSVTSILQVNGATVGIPQYVQLAFSSTTVTTSVSTATFTAVDGLSISLALLNPNDYIRISLTGVLSVNKSDDDAQLTIKRDSTDLGNPDGTGLAVAVTDLSPPAEIWRPVGVVITDFPGDTNVHTYQVFIGVSVGGVAAFPHSAGYLMAEEVSQ
jgi:hypothetical protein